MYFTSRLASIASAKVQEAYGLNGSVQSYLVPSELLEEAAECVTMVRQGHPITSSLTPIAKLRMLSLAETLNSEEARFLEHLSWGELLKHPAWLAIRASAQAVLAELHFNLGEWESNECASPHVP